MQRFLLSAGQKNQRILGRSGFVRLVLTLSVLGAFQGSVGVSLAQSSGDGSYSNNPQLNSVRPAVPCATNCGNSQGYAHAVPTQGQAVQLLGANQLRPAAPVNYSQQVSSPVPGNSGHAPAVSGSNRPSASVAYQVDSRTGIARDLALGVLNIDRNPGQNLSSAPREPYQPFFDVDWSLGLTYTHTGGTQSGKNFVTLTPRVSLTHQGLRGQFGFAGQTALSVNDDQLTRVDDTVFSYTGQYALDSVTGVLSGASVSINQEDVNAPGMPDTIVQTPVVTQLKGNVGLTRQMGRFNFDVNTEAERMASSDTLLVGGRGQNNADRNFSRLGGTLRTSYAFSPEISLFVQGGISHDWYDAAPVSTGLKLDGSDYTAEVGAVVNWRDVLELEATVGHTTRVYDDPGIVGMGSAVFGLDLSYTPNSALSAGLQFSTNLKTADATAGRPASVDYSASGNITYGLNSWIDLRASASALYSVPQSGTDLQTSYSAGAGADFQVNKNVSVNLDYLYTWAELLPKPAEYQHAGTIGIMIAR